MPEIKQTTLTTARLTLRWMNQDDTEALYAIYADPEVTRYWSSGAWTELKQAEESVAHTMAGYEDGKYLRFAVALNDGGPMIGTVSLYQFYPQNRRCEIGYAFASAHWGKGYAAEAVEAAVAYAFRELDINRIEADIDPRNAPSGRVLERVGFRKEGYMPERWIVNGESADTVYYGLLRRYWDERAAPFVSCGDR